jgi:RNA polymerase-binding transcription factor DksA
VKDGILRARSKLPSGPGRKRCEECDAPIPPARRKACPACGCACPARKTHDAEEAQGGAGYNRRGSKDSQLR